MIKEYSKTFYMSAGECNPQGEMPVSLLVSRLIEIATLHANSWGVGFDRLISDNHAWVLSRVTTEMKRYPRAGEDYEIITWIEDYNRHFSQRNMEIRSTTTGEVLGFARTIWMVIDLAARTGVDISQLSYISSNVSPRECPIEPQSRLRPVADATRTTEHTFGYTDCDFNRHVNTVRYLELLMNQFSLSHYDNNFIARMEMAFVKETHYGATAQVLINDSDEADTRFSINVEDTDRVRCRFTWKQR